jgi:hypothetical protein
MVFSPLPKLIAPASRLYLKYCVCVFVCVCVCVCVVCGVCVMCVIHNTKFYFKSAPSNHKSHIYIGPNKAPGIEETP